MRWNNAALNSCADTAGAMLRALRANQMFEIDILRAIPAAAALVGLVFALPTVVKVWSEIKYLHRGASRADAEFALKLNETLKDPALMQYAIELGYRSLVGDDSLTHSQRVVLVNLEEAESWVRKYLKVRAWVTVQTGKPVFKWKRSRHAHKMYRNFVIGLCFVGYVVNGVAALHLPDLLTALSIRPQMDVPIASRIYSAVYFGAIAALLLLHAARLNLAAKLIRDTKTRADGQRTESTPASVQEHCEDLRD